MIKFKLGVVPMLNFRYIHILPSLSLLIMLVGSMGCSSSNHDSGSGNLSVYSESWGSTSGAEPRYVYVAKPEEIFDFCRAKGLMLRRLSTCAGGKGCNQFVFDKRGA